MNSEQARMARALSKLGVREVAARAGMTPNTVSRIENGSDPKQSTIEALKRVYTSLGMQFLQTGEVAGGPGVALKNSANE